MLWPTPWRSRPRARHRLQVRLLGLALVAGLLVATATPAAADNDVRSVSPGGGADLTTSPAAVRIVFERPLLGLVAVSVRGPSGDATSGLVQQGVETVVQPLKARLPSGRYTVSWQAGMLDDSSGSTAFTIARKASRSTTKPSTTKPSPTPRATAKPSPTPSRTPKATRNPSRSPQAVALAGSDSGTGAPTAEYVAAPQVKGVGYTGSDHLPPPVVWWGLLLILAAGGYVIKKRLDARQVTEPRIVQRITPERAAGRRAQREEGPDERDST